MNRKRVIALAKLGILFGGPIALILGLFSCGVYCGHTSRVGILEFERDWLGMDVEVPSGGDDDDEAADKKGDEDDKAKDKAKDKEKEKKGDEDEDDGDSDQDGNANNKKSPKTKDAGEDGDEDEAKAPATKPVPAAPPPQAPPGVVVPPAEVEDPGPAVEVDPDLDSDLAALFDMPLTVRVKVLVDQELISARADWIDYVQRTVSQASMIYQEQFGITLELSAVGRWPVATAGMDSGQLLEDLRTRPQESADVVIGFTGRPLDEHVSGKAETPQQDSAFNGRVALVYGNARSQRPHLRTLLHEVSHLFGSKDITDRSDPNWLRKSWMSYAPVTDSERAWIDARNRKRILQSKGRPFPPQPATPAEEETP